ncbi:MAG: DNA polymerase III subunit beta [Rhodospirillales bacterium]|nr:MAG: DNA polymerase III subunit beta [Rhodospirillales bacterium]
MKLTIERAVLLRSLAHVQSVVERRTTIPILSNVKLEAGGDRLSLTATDMDLEVVEGTVAKVKAAGASTVPAHTLYDVVRKLPEGSEILLDSIDDADRIDIRCGRSRFTLPSLPVTDFPVMSGGEMAHEFRLPAGALRSLVDRTRFAISTEETRYYLNGIYLHQADHDGVAVLRAVATDGHRLASVEVPLPDGAANMPGIILPRKTVNELRKLIEATGSDVSIALSANKVRFTFDEVMLTSKLIDGTYPDYQRVIPVGNDKQLDVECRAFVGAVDRVAAICSETSRAVKLSVANGTLVLSASSPEHGSASEELEVNYQGDPLEIGFNSRYLLDITQQIEGVNARLDMSDAGSPTLLREVGDASALFVLMPMRV